MSFKADLLRLVHELESEENEAYSLWTWLPSQRAAEKYHGDYASNFKPSVSDIMKEACSYISDLKHGREIVEGELDYMCPCFEHVVIDEEKVKEAIAHGVTVTELSVAYEVEEHIIENILEFALSEEKYPTKAGT